MTNYRPKCVAELSGSQPGPAHIGRRSHPSSATASSSLLLRQLSIGDIPSLTWANSFPPCSKVHRCACTTVCDWAEM